MKRVCKHSFARRAICALALFVLLGAPSLAGAQLPGSFDGCGTLVAGAECPLFQADNGGLFLVENLGGFNLGDYVRVVGTLDLGCITVCLQGNGCIRSNTISLCSTTPVAHTTWGKVKALYAQHLNLSQRWSA